MPGLKPCDGGTGMLPWGAILLCGAIGAAWASGTMLLTTVPGLPYGTDGASGCNASGMLVAAAPWFFFFR